MDCNLTVQYVIVGPKDNNSVAHVLCYVIYAAHGSFRKCGGDTHGVHSKIGTLFFMMMLCNLSIRKGAHLECVLVSQFNVGKTTIS